MTGDKLRDAQRKLQEKDITDVSVQNSSTGDNSDNGRVLDQSPSPGSKVSPGDPVTLLVGKSAGGGGGSSSSSSAPTSSSGPGN